MQICPKQQNIYIAFTLHLAPFFNYHGKFAPNIIKNLPN